MKKNAKLLIILLFLVFAAIGVLAGKFLFPADITSPEQPENINQSSMQQKYLFIHATELDKNSSQLISAWSVFVFYSQPPHITIVPLYPADNETINKRLAQAFSLSPNGRLTQGFLNTIHRNYDLDTDGYLLVDNTGANYLSEVISGNGSSTPIYPPTTTLEQRSILDSANQTLKPFCDALSISGFKPMIENISWQKLLPDHFSTNLSFENLTLTAEKIMSSGSINDCTILISE